MSRTQFYTCDVCQSENNPLPPKWVVGTDATCNGILIMTGGEYKDMFEQYEDYETHPPADCCSIDCAAKQAMKLMEKMEVTQ